MTLTQTRDGFTLIELLVVIGIIAVLAALLFTNFSGMRERARDLQRKSDLGQVKGALRLYYNDYQKYPADNGSGVILGCGVNGTDACDWGTTFSAGAGSTIYMTQLPTDPVSASSYTYTYVDDDNFTITTTLENTSDDSAVKSQAKCGAQANPETYVVCND